MWTSGKYAAAKERKNGVNSRIDQYTQTYQMMHVVTMASVQPNTIYSIGYFWIYSNNSVELLIFIIRYSFYSIFFYKKRYLDFCQWSKLYQLQMVNQWSLFLYFWSFLQISLKIFMKISKGIDQTTKQTIKRQESWQKMALSTFIGLTYELET